MKNIKKTTTIILFLALLLIHQVTGSAQTAAPGIGAKKQTAAAADIKDPDEEKDTPSNVLNPENWYLKLSTVVSYYTFGADFDRMIGQFHGLADGTPLEIKVLGFNPSFSMTADDTVARADTKFIPTGNIGFGWISGKHQFEIDLGVAGMVPLNTIQVDTKMTMREKAGENTLATLGMVNETTGTGRYSFQVTMNEDIWILTPSFYYDYTVIEMPWGSFSTGGSLGLVFMSMSQSIDFKAVRTGVTVEEDQRAFEGSALSTAINGFGPVVRLYMGFKRPFFGDTRVEFRIGANYGKVTLQRDMDGYGMITMGDGSLPISFPLTDLYVDGKPFKNHEENSIELLGAFIQAAIIF